MFYVATQFVMLRQGLFSLCWNLCRDLVYLCLVYFYVATLRFLSRHHYKKNPDLQRKFCNEQIYCKMITDLQRNYNENLISKLQLTCNGLATRICNGFIYVAKHSGKLWHYSWRRHYNGFGRCKFATERFRCKLAID